MGFIGDFLGDTNELSLYDILAAGVLFGGFIALMFILIVKGLKYFSHI